MTQARAKFDGKVCLVGAGPGDAGLITVRGRQRLAQAQVVIYDALVGPELLDLAPPDAQRIDVGKRAGAHKLSQDQINELMFEHARAGRSVVRLKGGDPYLFGRGAEEAAYLAKQGIEFEVVPGLTAAMVLPAAVGVPLTHRQVASTVTFATGHEEPGKDESSVDYAALAALIGAGGTVCFYMGISRIAAIVEALIGQGVAPDMPTAVVQWVTAPSQKSVTTTLGEAPKAIERAGVWAPSIIVVGQVAGLDVIVHRPMFGQTVVITRTREQASELRELLIAQGARVLEAPTIRLVAPEDPAPMDDAVTRVEEYDWLVITSPNGVEAVEQVVKRLDLDARHFAGVKIATIGSATADALQSRLRLRADLVPANYVAEALADELIAAGEASGKRFLLLRADIARQALPQRLAAAGAEVTEVTAYESKTVEALPPAVLEAMRAGEVDWITFTSSSTARNMAALLGEEKDLLRQVGIASIGPITSGTLRELGLGPTIEADPSTMPGLVDAIVRAQTAGT